MASTQAQGKGKKKNKEVTKVPLEEFNQMNAPHGHSVISLKSLDWAETMADYDYQQPPEQILVPVAPRAQRGPGVDYDSLPNEPPFRVSLFNLPMSVEEKEVRERIFQDLDVLRVEITKSDTTVELGSKDALYNALCKDGATIKGRTVNVCLFGDSPQNFSDRYGGRGGNDRYGDRYGDRGSGGGFGGSRMGDRYGDRSGGGGGGFGRDRDGYSGGGYNRVGSGGFGQPRGGYGDRFDRDGPRDMNRGSYTSAGREPAPDREEPDNWRAAARPTVKPTATPTPDYNNGTRQPYVHPRPEPSHYQQPPARHQQYHQESSYQPRYQHNQSSESHFMPPSQYNDRPGPNSRIMNSEPAEERPKLVLQKRTAPINVDDVSSVPRNAAIFGAALPNSKTYEKMKEIEEKLSTVQVSERQTSSHGGSQPGSAPRSRQISERSRD